MTPVLDYEREPAALTYMLRAMLPARRPRLTAPGVVGMAARWRGLRVEPRALARFLAITGLPEGPTLPLLYPHTVGFRLTMALLTHPSFPVPIWGVLQIRNHLVQHRPIPITASLDLDVAVAAVRVVDKGAELDVRTTARVGDEVAWESVVTFLTRGRFGEPGAASPLARSPAVDGREVATWTMADDAHWRFGALTGDYNGIHAWDWYARRFGFERALYHPPRVLGQCLARLGELDRDAPQRLDAWIKGPVPHGATVRLTATGTADDTSFALHAGERPSIVGRYRRFAADHALDVTEA